MGMSDVNKKIEQQRRMSEMDKCVMEYETLEYWLTHKPETYGEDLKAAQERYAELKEYFERIDKSI